MGEPSKLALTYTILRSAPPIHLDIQSLFVDEIIIRLLQFFQSLTTFQLSLSIAMAEPATAPMQRSGGDNNSAMKKKKEMVDLKAQLENLRLETASLEHQLAVLSKQHEQDDSSTEDSTTNSNSISSSNFFCSQPPPPAWVAGAGGHTLTASQIQRYSRQLLLPSFGVEAQERLAKGSVLVVGAGGLGSPVAMYLAAGGVGRLGIMDPDCVEVHNLHRQVIHNESSIGEAKVESAKRACLAINSSLEVRLPSISYRYCKTHSYLYRKLP